MVFVFYILVVILEFNVYVRAKNGSSFFVLVFSARYKKRGRDTRKMIKLKVVIFFFEIC